MKLETFSEKFVQFTDASDAVAKMRELILTLAISGRLLEQRNETKPSLDKLLHKKELVLKKAKVRKHPKTNAPAPEELLFEAPSNWLACRLGDLCWSAPTAYGENPSPDLITKLVVKVGNISPDGFFKGEFSERGFASDKVASLTARAGDLMVVKSSGSAENVHSGKTAICATEHENKLVGSNFVLRLRPLSSLIDHLYLWRVVTSRPTRRWVEGTVQTMTYPNLKWPDYSQLPIALPPLAEQKRIVAKVDELMALCDQLEAQQQERDTRHTTLARASLARFADAPTPANLNFLFHKAYSIPPADLRKSILTLAVQGKLVPQDPEDEPIEKFFKRICNLRKLAKVKDYSPVPIDEHPYHIPSSWEWVKLGNICLTSDSGWSPQCRPEQRTGDQWGVIKVSAVSWGIFKPEENKALPAEKDPRPACEVKPGDFLLSRANTDDLVARSVVVQKTPKHLMMSDKIVRFTFPNEIEPNYINLANSSIHARAYYSKNASGTSSSMKNVGRGVMCNLPIPLPPIPEQRRIVAKVDQLMALVDELETQLAESRATDQKLLEALVANLTATPS
jgi:type I restriction enzyme S subunit